MRFQYLTAAESFFSSMVGWLLSSSRTDAE
jgi:hypothetical protein